MSTGRRYPRPKVSKLGCLWMASVTRGFDGNYEHDRKFFESWREAFDWAYGQVKDWNPSLLHRRSA